MTQDSLDSSGAMIRRLENHPVYSSIQSPRDLRTFLEHHVVCVFDFMSLLKRLQADLTCTQSPWVPSSDLVSARIINEIVLDEESDKSFGKEPSSHYAWYVAAMDEIGANTRPIRKFEKRIRGGMDPVGAILGCGLPEAAEEFLATTFQLTREPTHKVASAFVLGRENVIPRMFLPLVQGLRESGLSCDLLLRYLERHVEIDSGEHGPAAMAMLERITGSDEKRIEEANQAARTSLQARERLWDEVYRVITTKSSQPVLH